MKETLSDINDASFNPEIKIAMGLTKIDRILMLAVNFFPILHVICVILIISIGWGAFQWRLIAGLAFLYLVPPILARLVMFRSPIHKGRIKASGKEFLVWWTLCSLQMVFNRLPILEELIRLVPGLYSSWLRLWGAKVGRLTYWGAGVLILDRSFVQIGDDVVFGASVRINPHVMIRNEDQEHELLLSDVIVGDRAIVGGYSLLTAGTEITQDECTRAFLISPPFSKWKGGVRVSKGEL